MHLCLSLPKEVGEELIQRAVQLALENPKEGTNVSKTAAQHLRYAFKAPLCDVVNGGEKEQ